MEYVEGKLGIKIERVKSNKWDWFSLCRHYGKFFDSRRRACTERLKLSPISKWVTACCNRKKDLLLTGERCEESKKRSSYTQYYYNKKIRINAYRPLLYWTTQDVFTAIRQAGLLLNPVYKHFTRLGCYCCVFNTNSEWIALHKYYPELFEKVAKLEEELNYTVRYGKSLRQLITNS